MPARIHDITAAKESFTQRLPRTFIVMSTVKDYVLFVGVIFHELFHFIAATLVGLEVTDYSFFKRSNNSEVGYIDYTGDLALWKIFFVNVAPMLFGLPIGIGMILLAPPMSGAPLYIYYYLAISITAKSFISLPDIEQVLMYGRQRRKSAGLLIPLIGAMKIFAYASLFWIDIALPIAVIVLM